MESMEQTQPAAGAGEALVHGGVRALDPGLQLGRYLILERLGVGAMGVVFAAYDPQLDRKIALKLLLPRGRDREDGGARLQREAQALAKLAHPNVVGVHDVGEHEGRVFVAMEFVAGATLGEWLEHESRGVDEILEAFRSAGLGLAAAHAAGLVHRDFKPDNVMVGSDGRVRVMDFGLARAEGDHEPDDTPPTLDESSPLSSALSTRLTQTGALLGTPAYMAAEQFAGQRGDARSDQFSFCVTLWDAFHGQRPFAGETSAALAFAVTRGELREPPPSSQMPARVRKALIRGLSPEPSERFASMDALLDASAPPRRGRAGWWAAGIVAVVAATGLGYSFARTSEPPRPCEDMNAPLAEVWGEQRRASVEASLLATEVSYAADTWSRVEGRLDAWAERWAAQRHDARAATRIRAEQSDEAMDLRMRCLDAHLEALAATVEVLGRADATVLSKAVLTVDRLPSPDRCADLDSLRARLPSPKDPQLAAEVDTLEGKLARSPALGLAAKHEEALALANEADRAARELDYPPIQVRALLERGLAESKVSRYEEAAASLIDAYSQALGERMIDEAAFASSRLVFLLGFALNRPEDALDWGVHGLALAEASTTPEARATILNSLGAARWSNGELEAADELYRRAAKLMAEALGPEHPKRASMLQNRSLVLNTLGRHEEARALGEQALSMLETSLGPEHPDVAQGLNALAGVAFNEGHLDDARRDFERALAISEGALGPEHPDVAVIVAGLGIVAKSQGRLDDARALHTRALAILGERFGTDHPEYARELTNLGLVMAAQRDWSEALAAFERSLETWEAATSATEVELAHPLTGIGRALIELNRSAEAIAPLERAVSLRAKSPDLEAPTRAKFLLARALWSAPKPTQDRARARALAGEIRGASPGFDQSSAEWNRE